MLPGIFIMLKDNKLQMIEKLLMFINFAKELINIKFKFTFDVLAEIWQHSSDNELVIIGFIVCKGLFGKEMEVNFVTVLHPMPQLHTSFE
jgi:hypothetical protein